MGLAVTPGEGAELETHFALGKHTPKHVRVEVDSSGAPFVPSMGALAIAYTRTDGLITGELRTSVVGGVTRTKTLTYARTDGLITAMTEGPWTPA